MKPDFDFEEKQSGSSGILFWVFAVIALFMFLGTNALWGSEDRWAEIAREMIATGDYLHPAVSWRIYFDKPQLSYWFIIPFACIFGMEELAARIPSALAALAALFGAWHLAQQLFDRKTAVLGCWLLASCYGFLFWGRTAAAEAANMAAAILAVSWFYYAEKKPNFWKYLVFYLIAFCGALTKGLPAIAVPVVFVFPHLIVENRWKSHLRVGNFAAFFIGVAVYFLPFYIASIVPPASRFLPPEGPVLSGLELVWRENIVRAFNAFDHKDWFFSYLYHLPRILLPWAPIFVLTLLSAFAVRKQLDSRRKEFLWGIIFVFLMFSASTSRRWYYILPLAPFCSIFTSAMVYREGEDKWLQLVIRIMRGLVIGVGALGLVSPVMLPVFSMMFKHYPPLLASIAIPVAGLITLIVCLLDNKPGNRIEHMTGIPHKLASMTIGLAVLSATVFGAIYPSLTHYRTEKPFILEMRPLLAGIPESNIIFYGTDSAAKFHFYMKWNGPTALARKQKPGKPSELQEFIRKKAGSKIAVITFSRKREHEPMLKELAGAGIAAGELVPVKTEPGKGKKWIVYVLNAPAEPSRTMTK